MAMQWVARRMTLLAGHQQRLRGAVTFSSSSSTLSSSLPLAAALAGATPASSWSSSPSADLCGCGDKKTKRGKRFKGSYGNVRPKLKNKIERIKDKLEVPRSTLW